MINWGSVPAGSVLPFMFGAYGANGESLTLSGLAVTDIEVYKGTSMTQRSSDNGYALIDTDGIDIDSRTGIHGFSIDTGDNTDSGFYSVGSFFTVVLDAVTINSQTVRFVAGTFRLMAAEATAGYPVTTNKVGTGTGEINLSSGVVPANVTQFGGSNGTFSGGRAEVNVSHWLGTAAATPTVAGVPEVDVTHWLGTAAQGASGRPQVDVELWLGSAPNALVSGRVDASAGALANNVITTASINDGALTAAKAASGFFDAVWTVSARALTVLDEDSTTLDLDATIRAALGMSSANLDTQLSTIDTVVDAVKAKTDNLPSDPADASVVAGLIAGVDGKIDTIDTVVDAIKVTTDKLDDTLEDDAGTFRFTENALEEAPAGGGGGGPTAVEIADEVQTRTIAGVTTVGTVNALAANSVNASALAADAVTEIQSGLATSAALATVDGIVDDILADTADMQPKLGTPAGASISADIAAIEAQTDDIGVSGAGLSAIPWNSAWDAEVQSEVADALAVYDPPTKAELDAAVAPLALEATLAVVDGVADAIKLKTDNLPSDPADASVIAGRFDTLDASIGDLPTNAELATALDPLPTANENADALLDRANAIETGVTPRGFMRVAGAVLAGKVSGGQTGSETFRNMSADSKDRVTSTNDASGNRTAVSVDMT